MASQKKIVIITSDEDLIQQLSLHKTLNTRIIDLDDNNHSASTTNDNTDVTDLTFLAQLSQPKSICEHVDKHVLESPQDNESKVAKMTEKNHCTVCVVCGDHASGFNYGALTCASCKTFFRRNALQPSEKIHCLEGRGTCFVSHGMRRKCQQCRLKRCFATGMRKDYFVSEEEKQRRRKRLLDSMHHSTVPLPSTKITSPSVPLLSSTQLSMNINTDAVIAPFYKSIDSNEIPNMPSKTLLVEEDWLAIQTIDSSYLLACQQPPPSDSYVFSDRKSLFAYCSQVKDQRTLQFIAFLRQIKEFEALNEEDRFILIKYNLLPMCTLYKCTVFNPQMGALCDVPNVEITMYEHFLSFDGELTSLCDAFTDLCGSIIRVTEHDLTLLRLLIVALLFSKGLSMSKDEPRLTDPLAVHRAHSHYTRLVWNYWIDRQGEQKTIRQFTQLLNLIFRIQSMMEKFRDFSRTHFDSPDYKDFISPLMRALFHIN